VTAPVTITEAVLGAKVDIPTPHGTVAVTVPPNSDSGRVLRLKGLGIKSDKAAGDLLVELEIEVPEFLPPDRADALRAALEGMEPSNVRSELSW
jgi:DnaJ-class molecular chaperone